MPEQQSAGWEEGREGDGGEAAEGDGAPEGGGSVGGLRGGRGEVLEEEDGGEPPPEADLCFVL